MRLTGILRLRSCRIDVVAFALTLVAGALPLTLAQEKAKPVPQTADSGCVWKISDGDSTVFLAGSVHLLRKADYPLPRVFDMVYAQSERLVFEIDMSVMNDPDTQAEMQKLGSYPEDESLEDHISGKTFQRIQNYFESTKEDVLLARQLASAPVLRRFKPGMLVLLISGIEYQRLGARPDLGLETQYFQRSEKDEKPSGGLETVQYQMSRFDELTAEESEALIKDTLDHLKELPEMIDRLIKAWHKGDTAELEKLMSDQMTSDDRLRELLLTERNQNWVPEVEKALEGSENVMFIVGAAHLIGEDSVIDLLEKKGYTVERVKPGGRAAAKKKAA